MNQLLLFVFLFLILPIIFIITLSFLALFIMRSEKKLIRGKVYGIVFGILVGLVILVLGHNQFSNLL